MRKPRILVVEDDPDMRDLVSLSLRKEGYDVTEVGDGIGLLDRLGGSEWDGRAPDFDAIVSDVMMPDLSAIEVLDALRCRNLTIPVVLMSAYGDRLTRDQARSLGAAAFLDKPLDLQQLRAAVREAVCPRGAQGH